MKFLFKPLIAVIICTFALFLSIVSGCTNIAPPDELEIDYSIGDWNDGGDYESHPDSVRNMTHADSIRFGYIKN